MGDKHTALHRYQREPNLFISNVLGASLWSKQQEIAQSVADHPYVAVRTGHGVGKTFMDATLILWWTYCHPRSICLTTAPTWFQVENFLWRDVRKLHARSKLPLGGDLLTTRIELDNDWWAAGRSTRDANFWAGAHAEHVLIILDEACSVESTIYEGMKTSLAGAHTRVVLTGNPVDPTTEFAAAFQDPKYKGYRISCYEHPNVVQNKIIYPGCVTRQWIDDRKAEWFGTPIWEPRVEGEFPQAAPDQLISLAVIEKARHRVPPALHKGPVVLGADIARFGSDETVIYIGQDGEVLHEEYLRGADLMRTANTCYMRGQEFGVTVFVIDDTGLGGGVVDRLRELDCRVIAIDYSSTPRDPKRYYDVPSELWCTLRDAMEGGKFGPFADPVLEAQLAARKYTYQSDKSSNIRIKIESKQIVKGRGLPSPDRADALTLLNWGMFLTRPDAIIVEVVDATPKAKQPLPEWDAPRDRGRRPRASKLRW